MNEEEYMVERCKYGGEDIMNIKILLKLELNKL